MTEATIQAGIQDVIQAMPEFANADVVINDYGIFDQSSSAAPYVLIRSADEFTSRQDVKTPDTTYQVLVMLVERFTDWKETLDNLTTRRDALLTKFNGVAGERAANGLTATTVDAIRSESEIEFILNPYLSPEELPEALPEWIAHTMIFEAREF